MLPRARPAKILPAIAVLAIACAMSPARARAYRPKTIKNTGAVAGTVKFAGAPPPRAPVEVSKDRDVCGAAPHYDESLVVDKNRGIANAVVSISDIAAGAPMVALKKVKFDQKDCDYIPHVLAMPSGSTVDIVNSDGILHSVRTESNRNPPLDMAQPGFKHDIVTAPLKYPETIRVSCDAHNWMQGWWYVAANPYYAVTAADGSFAIKDIPPGSYTLAVWQEKLGTQTRKVTVAPDRTTRLEIAMPAGEK